MSKPSAAIRPARGLRLKAGGVQLADGQVIAQKTDPAQPNYINTTKPFPKEYKLFYPFGPGSEGATKRVIGSFPTFQVD